MSTGIFQPGSISPLTTKGDLYGFSSGDAKIPVGSDGQVLTADAAQTLGVKWAPVSAVAAFTASSTAKTSGFTAIGNNLYLMDGSGGTYTVTFDVASGYSGQLMSFKRVDNTITKPITMTVNGSTTVHAVTLDESWLYYSDGANWRMINHFAHTNWSASTGLSIIATGSAITKGTTIVVDAIKWMREGKNAVVRVDYSQSNAGSAGSGQYNIALPAGIVADTSVVPSDTAVVSDLNQNNTLQQSLLECLGGGIAITASTRGVIFSVLLSGSTVICPMQTGAGFQPWGQGNFTLGVANTALSFVFRVAVSGWEP